MGKIINRHWEGSPHLPTSAEVLMIELSHLNVAYDNQIPVLKDLSLNINKGELLMIMGKSGSGKTTLLKVIDGLLPPQSGSYQFQGVDVYALSKAKRKQSCTQKIGFIWQDYRLISEINVLNNILLPTLITGADYDREYLDQLLKLLAIERYLKQYPNKLSGGEQQRVAMARALVLKPELLVADEPSGALDSKTSRQVMELFLRIQKQLGTTFVVATHDQEFAAMGTRRIEIWDGQVMNDETPLKN